MASQRCGVRALVTLLSFSLLYFCYVIFDPTFRTNNYNIPKDDRRQHGTITRDSSINSSRLASAESGAPNGRPDNVANRLTADATNSQAVNKMTQGPNARYAEEQIDIEKTTPTLDELYRRIALVTAFSQNHYREALAFIASVQDKMPDKTIIIYDLGINKETAQNVKRLCNVEVRPFPCGSYPNHVKNLLNYAWKPIIIDITLREFGAIFWGDASVRFKASIRQLLPFSTKHHGFMSHWHSFDPKVRTKVTHQYFHTYPKTYANLGVDRAKYYASENMAAYPAANRQLYINSSVIQEKLVQPMLRCALEQRCIAPLGSRFGKHRFDASVLAILIYKNLRGEWTPEDNNDAFDAAIDIQRNTIGSNKAQTCTSSK